jgi:hypothetical protein
MMKQLATAATIALAVAASGAPALAHDGNHRGGWNGGGYHHHYGNGWGWRAPLLGGLAGSAIIGYGLAAPYYGYGGYGYAPYYSYPTPFVPPQPRWCPGPYGPYQC